MQGAGFEPAKALGHKASRERQRLQIFEYAELRRSLDLNLAPLARLGNPCEWNEQGSKASPAYTALPDLRK